MYPTSVWFFQIMVICFITEWMPLVSHMSKVRDEHSPLLNKFIFPGFGQEMLW